MRCKAIVQTTLHPFHLWLGLVFLLWVGLLPQLLVLLVLRRLPLLQHQGQRTVVGQALPAEVGQVFLPVEVTAVPVPVLLRQAQGAPMVRPQVVAIQHRSVMQPYRISGQ